jgi:hypothetical protein
MLTLPISNASASAGDPMMKTSGRGTVPVRARISPSFVSITIGSSPPSICTATGFAFGVRSRRYISIGSAIQRADLTVA